MAIKIGATLGVINIGETALIERFGSVLGAVIDVLDLAFLRPAIPSSMTDAFICAVVTTERFGQVHLASAKLPPRSVEMSPDHNWHHSRVHEHAQD